MTKKIIKLTESELIHVIKKVISEAKLKSTDTATVMGLQSDILGYEIQNNIASFVEGNPIGCKKPKYNYYRQGELTNKRCVLTGSTLCGGPCYQNNAIDGVYGSLTKAAYENYKDVTILAGTKSVRLEDVYGSDDYSVNDDWGISTTENWQIPAYMTNIKAFQWYVWRKIEGNTTHEGTSILCGGNPCKDTQAIDGSWGTNTKKAWNQYKDQYYDDEYSVTTKYEDMPDSFS